MAKSHQRGTVRLEHYSWVGYMNVKVLDPNTGESKWKKQRVGVLGAKSQMTKYQAHDELERIIAQKTPGTTEPRADESIVTLGWNVKDVQGILGHENPDMTAGVYMQPLEERVKQTLDWIYGELTAGPKLVAVE